ncbi:NAD-dependent epimerase/dehydratase family protein [Paenibacillus nanensis]|uniref:NAD-dependent epimerase/dehydratase family protein n=1 Tax=Paenibacillus nanensis TaxID=393251 RepID=A0A3A1UU74_9BACL|nr:NAD(P)H-binding protein [Paenibacillus nanensis]RIX50971.1 NAD-dependent epimerase/dehydratase family protein [Paenibacillus nanensis]
MERTALIAGATGLVGSELVKLLLERRTYKKITVLVRKRMNMAHPRLEQLVIDYDELEKVPADKFEGADLYCALGTTRRKAGSKEQFERVDYGYPMTLGRLAKRYGTERMLVVSAMGADEKSIFFYSQVKGRLERDLQALSLKRLHFFRPSLIIGNRQEHRFGEELAAKLARWLPFLFQGPMRKYKPISAKQIAEAMLVAAMSREDAPLIIPSDEIAALAKRLRNVSL